MSTRKKSKATQVLEELLGGPLSFGDALNAARLNAEVSQGELGERVGMSRSRICDIEKGRRGVTLEKAAALARALGMSETVFVKLALQDSVDRAGFDFVVDVHAA